MINALMMWLWNQVWPNLVASAIAWVIALFTAWFWKLRPHFRKVHATHQQIIARLDAQDQALGIGKD